MNWFIGVKTIGNQGLVITIVQNTKNKKIKEVKA